MWELTKPELELYTDWIFTNSKTLRGRKGDTFGLSEFNVTTHSYTDDYVLGWAEAYDKGDYDISIAMYEDMTLSDYLSTLAHELVHCRMHYKYGDHAMHIHDDRFHKLAIQVGNEIGLKII